MPRSLPALLALFALTVPVTAFAVSRTCGTDPLQNTEDVLCASPSGPCTTSLVTVSSDIAVPTGNCAFDLAGRALRIERSFEITGSGFAKFENAGDVTVTSTGKLKSRGDFVKPQGYIISGGRLSVESGGAITVEGLLDVSGDPSGKIILRAANDVVLVNGAEIRGVGITSFADQGDRFADAGEAELISLGGSVFMAADVSMRATNQALGGFLKLQSARDSVIEGPVDLSGGGSDGGELDIEAGDHVRISRSVDVSSRVGGGFGGFVDISAGDDDLGGVVAGGDVTLLDASIQAQGSAAEQFGGDGGDISIFALGSIRIVGSHSVIHADAAQGFDGWGGSLTLDGSDFAFFKTGPLDGDVVVEGVITALGGALGGVGGFLDVTAGRDLEVSADIDLSGDDGGGDLDFVAGGAMTVTGKIAARATASTGSPGFVDFEAGTSQGGDAGRLMIAGDVLASGGADNGDAQNISFAGCTLTVAENITIDGHAGVNPGGRLGGSDITLVSRGLLQLGAGSRYLATERGTIVLRHPSDQAPIIGDGATFDPPYTADSTPFNFPNCPVCGDAILQAGERCDDGAGNGADNCCTADCELVDGDRDGVCDASDPCLEDHDNDSDGDGFCVGESFQAPAIGGDDPCSRVDGSGDWIKPKVTLARLDGEPGRGTLKLKGGFIVPASGSPIAPDVYGVQVRVVDAAGTLVVDEHVPGGSFDDDESVGWKVRGTPASQWIYVDKGNHPALANGIAKIIVTDASRKTPGLIKVAIIGTEGSYPLDPDQAPMAVSFELNDTAGPPGGAPGIDQCGETQFDLPPGTPSCQVRGAAKVICK